MTSEHPIIDPPLDEPQPGDPAPHEVVTGDVPGQERFGPVVERFDEAVDAALERVRGNPAADAIFRAASTAGDFSLIWHVTNVAVVVLRRRPGAPARALTFAALIGLESLVVNQGVKRLFHRTRPTTAGDERLRVRHPRTSSFPSGHASAATFAASMLAPRAGRAAPAVAAAAGVVAVSRAYVRIHHASDVVAGLATGAALAAAARGALGALGLRRLV